MYSSENLIWIKNVKRNHGEDFAYDDVGCEKTFWLNWPTSKKGSASTPKTSDIIALFQKPNIQTDKIGTLISKTEQSLSRQQEYRTALISTAVTGKIKVTQEEG